MDEIARRGFVKGAALGTALGAFAFTVGGVEVLLTPRQARAQGASLRVLKPEEAQTLEAIGDTLAASSARARASTSAAMRRSMQPSSAISSMRCGKASSKTGRARPRPTSI
jgi:hypothetical protein